MKDLFDAGLRGRLPLFIQGFLQNRQFQVRLGSHMSDSFDQEMGVPQGSILSVILFALKINSIVKNLSPGVECSLYVDDFVICYRSKFIHITGICWNMFSLIICMSNIEQYLHNTCSQGCRLRSRFPRLFLISWITNLELIHIEMKPEGIWMTCEKYVTIDKAVQYITRTWQTLPRQNVITYFII